MRSQLQRQLEPYRRAHPNVRWTRPETWHLTLLFLGSVEPERTPELVGLIDDLALGVQPYRALVDHGGGRDRGGDGVAWLGLSEGAGTLIALAISAAQGCPPDITDGPSPKRTPSAHLTVVRKADQAVIRALSDQAYGHIGVDWRIDRIGLFRSYLEPAGARYVTVHEATL